MTGDRILVSASPGEWRVAVLRDGELQAVAIDRPDLPDGVGDIHLGRVTAVSAAMSGAFVEIAGGESAFLPENETPPPRRPITKAVSEGDWLLLRVMRAAQGAKGPRVTMRIDNPPPLPASRKPQLIARGPTGAERLARLLPDLPVETNSAAVMALLGRDRARLVQGSAFDEATESAFAELAEPVVLLPGGLRLHIHPTPALVAIDVDAGRAAGLGDASAHGRVNEAAAAEVARQIRLRNLSGAILVDFAGLPIRKRPTVLPPLEKALAADPLAPDLLGVTRIGLVEVMRRRVHPPLHEVLGSPASAVTRLLAALRAMARDAAARPHRALALRAAPEVVAAAAALPIALAEYQAATGRRLVLRADRALRPDEAEIEEDRP
ncbi:ribonuclease E/G [Falsiroseomonas stagni]|uniref:Ribonuclease, Rne/Rng family n=1 Tax=Falsiroseomonas stagni DSM 19981 TaxID=1123062 RepID=A0A1I3YFV9_9PROT|nr:ribonuclease E/G [Falsiroseomonas stagni]SFK30249.1 ribonuclease, Rne/Rng family [Falsiroseomonas stagni DSM 19981]